MCYIASYNQPCVFLIRISKKKKKELRLGGRCGVILDRLWTRTSRVSTCKPERVWSPLEPNSNTLFFLT